MENNSPSSQEPVSFKDTLNLQGTDFPIRPNAKVDDPALIERWQREGLYEKAMALNTGSEAFILHDGPPYANGNIHLGHAYNKILKDIVTKSRRMAGFHVPVTPGWDCHGLPIEFKVSQENPGLTKEQRIAACREYAQKWIDVQRSEFKRLGVVMDWDNPYITMKPSYEADTLRAFGILVERGYITRGNKTVAWCATCQTVLASTSAEIEYKDRKDPSLYVKFTIPDGIDGISKPVSLLAWTTTPWTLPLNRGLMIKPGTRYALLDCGDEMVIVGASRAEKVAEISGKSCTVVKQIPAEELSAISVQHPFDAERLVPIILEEEVGLDDGTAVVHMAPGCGPLDYEVAVKHGIEIFSPITPDGRYAVDIAPKELEGMPVTDGQIWAIKDLARRGLLLAKQSIVHSYPHCWRCHNGLIFRATKQWFFNLTHDAVKERALAAIEKMSFTPKTGRNFLSATITNRWEWCLSRQRVWGVPIAALLCKVCDAPYINRSFIDRVAEKIAQEGIEYWQRVTVEELVHDIACGACGGHEFAKEMDILDVWFDSGTSHFAVLEEKKQFPANVYLEGIDQHRGWFQSSLLTSMAIEQQPCMKGIITHGFTVDGDGQKMSKSIGNVVAPQTIIDQLGTDGLRLWAAAIDQEGDAVVSQVLLNNVAEVYRKIRNTCRFMLQNLYDFDPAKDSVPVEKMLPLDRYAMLRAVLVNDQLVEHYMQYRFSGVFHGLADYCAKDLSSFYCDVLKDRLYVEQADGFKRRSAQTALWHILDMLTRVQAPILSFTAELVSDVANPHKKESIHLASFAAFESIKAYYGQKNDAVHFAAREDVIREIEQWDALLILRDALLKAIEGERAKGLIKHPLEAQVTLCMAPQRPGYDAIQMLFASLAAYGQTPEELLKELMVVSQVVIESDSARLSPSDLVGLAVLVEHASGEKCPRCWHWNTDNNPHDLCDRCKAIVALSKI